MIEEPSLPVVPDTDSRSNNQDAIGFWLLVVGSLSIFLISGSLHFLTWISEQFALSAGLTWARWLWFAVALLQGILIGVPALILARFWPTQRYKPVFRTWAISALFVLILSPLRWIQPPATQLANVVQIVLVAVFLAILWLLKRARPTSGLPSSSSRLPAAFIGLSIAAAVSYPWLVIGALGSSLDTALNLAAGLLFGISVGQLISASLLDPIRRETKGTGHDLALGGLAAGSALFVMSSAFGFNGIQLMLMVIFPPLAVAINGCGWFARDEKAVANSRAIALVTGITAAAPAIFVDPDEFVLILIAGPRDIPYWITRAAMLSVFIGIAASLLMFLLRHRLSRVIDSKWPAALAVVSWLVGFVLFFLVGQPGFHGDQLFVIMAEQADLTTLGEDPGNNQRARDIYELLTSHAESTQKDLRRDLDRTGFEYKSYYLVNGLVVNAGPLVGQWLEQRPDVDRVMENPILRPLPAVLDLSSGQEHRPDGVEWNLSMIGADLVWAELGAAGEGIVIGHADSGVQGDHPELISSYRGLTQGDDYNWLDPWFDSPSPGDYNGHGTHTLGIILGEHTGVAPEATWFACANLVRGLANTALYLDCLQFLLAPYPRGAEPFTAGDPSRAAHIINNSWLCPEIEGCDEHTMSEAVRALRKAGVFMVVSAGNEGPWCGSVQYPLAIFDEVFSVGAVDENGELAIFSSIGPVNADGSGRTKPDIVAPGEDILSAFPQDTYELQSGTSMAGPHVAGVVALMWSANPSLIGDIEATEQILWSSATPFKGSLPACVGSSTLPNNAVGYGILDAYEAVKLAKRYS